MRYTKNEINFLKNNYSKNGVAYCANVLKRSRASIENKVSKLGLVCDKKTIKRLKQEYWIHNPKKDKKPEEYNVNPNAFINCSNKKIAYLLGLLWADGNIYKNRVSINSLAKDANQFIPIFMETGKWNVYYSKQVGRKPQKHIYTNNKILSSFLVSCGYGPNTFISACDILNKIPDKLKVFWFRGLIDGDGCWYINSKNNHSKQFTLSGGYNQDWKYFINLLNQLEIKHKVIKTIRNAKNGKRHKSSYVRIYGLNNLIKLGDFIYTSYSQDKIGLKRKYNKYLDIKSTRKVFTPTVGTSTWIIISPNGKKEKTHILSKYCSENGLTASCMSSVASGNLKHHKGYKCIKLPLK